MSVEPSAFLLKEQELMKLNEEINLKTKSVLSRTKPALPAKVKPKDGKVQPQKLNPVQMKPEPVQKTTTPKDETVVEEPLVPLIEIPNNVHVSAKPITKIGNQRTAAAIPQSLERKNLSSEGLIKFLKSKVTILQDEIDVQQKENLKKAEEVHSLAQKTLRWEKQRDDLQTKNNSLQAELKRAEEKIIELELKVKERDNDTVRLGKESEAARRDLKTLQQMIGALEKRLLNAQNEVESLKVNLASAYDREREGRDQHSAERDAAEKQIKQLRKQRVSLITAYKQQLLLLDNLKRQNLCLEEAKMLEFSEKEFTKILNWEK